jgi:predicted transcriptional regulator
MAKEPWMHDYGDKWDKADVESLIHLYDESKLTVLAIAGMLGRSESAVRSKLYRLRKQGVKVGG